MKPYQKAYESTYPIYGKTAAATPEKLDFNTLVVQPIEGMLAQIVGFIPDVLAGIYILVFGWIIAKVLQFMFTKFLTAIRFNTIADKTGITALLEEGKSTVSASEWFGNLVYWITIFTSVVMALDRFELRMASDRLDQIMYLFVSALTAIVTLTLGMFLSMIVARIVETTAKNLSVPKPALHAGIIRWTILVFTLILTISQFQIPPQFLLIAIGVVFAALCLTFIVAFGIGGRVWAGKVLDRLY